TQLYFQTATYIGNGNWSPAPGSTVAPGLQPGSGVWVRLIQANGTPTPITLTTVGNVIQGTHSLAIVGAVPAKYQFLSIIPPLSTGIQTGMGLTPTAGDQVFQFDSIAQGYKPTHTRLASSWQNGEPTPAVGEAFFYASRSNTNWVQSFTVQ